MATRACRSRPAPPASSSSSAGSTRTASRWSRSAAASPVIDGERSPPPCLARAGGRPIPESMPSHNRVRFAVVGQGYFAQSAILPAFKSVKNAELAALVGGDDDKLEKLGRMYGVDTCV